MKTTNRAVCKSVQKCCKTPAILIEFPEPRGSALRQTSVKSEPRKLSHATLKSWSLRPLPSLLPSELCFPKPLHAFASKLSTHRRAVTPTNLSRGWIPEKPRIIRRPFHKKLKRSKVLDFGIRPNKTFGVLPRKVKTAAGSPSHGRRDNENSGEKTPSGKLWKYTSPKPVLEFSPDFTIQTMTPTVPSKKETKKMKYSANSFTPRFTTDAFTVRGKSYYCPKRVDSMKIKPVAMFIKSERGNEWLRQRNIQTQPFCSEVEGRVKKITIPSGLISTGKVTVKIPRVFGKNGAENPFDTDM